ncbi:MAG TPA: hypothetical protein VFJ43_17835, partial [Bacteroidia bacterium]|nr:hypothetical protein [Bacteroidia bacterium]
DYNKTNITAIKFNADGSQKWVQTINRDVKSRNDGGKFLGIYACMMGENLVITYQDFLYLHDGKPHMVVAPPLSMYRVNVIRKINADGIMVSETYLNDKRFAGSEAEYALLPVTGMKINDTTMWFTASRGLELVSAKVTLQ